MKYPTFLKIAIFWEDSLTVRDTRILLESNHSTHWLRRAVPQARNCGRYWPQWFASATPDLSLCVKSCWYSPHYAAYEAMTTSHCRPILSCFFAPCASCSLRLARFNCCAGYPRFAPWRPHEIPMSWSFPNHQKCPFAQARCCQALGSASCGFQLPAQKGSFQWNNGNQGLTFPAFVLHPILT